MYKIDATGIDGARVKSDTYVQAQSTRSTMRTEHLHMLVSPEEMREIRELAARERESVSSVMRRAVRQAVLGSRVHGGMAPHPTNGVRIGD